MDLKSSGTTQGWLHRASSAVEIVPLVGGVLALAGFLVHLLVPTQSKLGLLLFGVAFLFLLNPLWGIIGWILSIFHTARPVPTTSDARSLRARMRARLAVRFLHLLPLIGGALFTCALATHVLVPAARGTSGLTAVLMAAGFSVLGYPLWAFLAAGIARVFGVENKVPWL